jgi:hypothetical protein
VVQQLLVPPTAVPFQVMVAATLARSAARLGLGTVTYTVGRTFAASDLYMNGRTQLRFPPLWLRFTSAP